MAKHNYSQYSKKKHKPEPVAEVKMDSSPAINEPVVLMGPIDIMPETVETVALPKTVEGTVVNCAKLNVRSEPSIDAEVIYILDVMSEIEIDIEKSTRDWFSVCTATGVEGYCMRKFVEACL